jgi:hypothetical protein
MPVWEVKRPVRAPITSGGHLQPDIVRPLCLQSTHAMSNPWDSLDEHTRAILEGHSLEGVVAVRPSVVRALQGHGNAAILLCQLLYWCRRLGDGEGWFYQSQRRLKAQTGLGPDAQRKAVRLLERLGVLDTVRQGMPARLFYRLDLPRLTVLLLQRGQAVSVGDHARQQDADHGLELDPEHSPQQDGGDGRPQAVGHGPPHKETNKDIRAEIIRESGDYTRGDYKRSPSFPSTGDADSAKESRSPANSPASPARRLRNHSSHARVGC